MFHCIRFLLLFITVSLSGYSLASAYDYQFPQNMQNYEPGVRVLASDGNIYECKYDPHVNACQIWNSANNDFEPGTGSEWQAAWTLINQGSGQQSAMERTGNFKFVVMADPQAWRYPNGGDPNSDKNRGEWENINNRVVESLNQLKKSADVRFAILNGDITEFGRDSQWASYHRVYDKLSFPSYIGLGNHDYANNVSDCYQGSLSNNNCAGKSVARMRSLMSGYAGGLSYYNDHVYGAYNATRGSMSYSWDYGSIHFVQLHNYPTYSRDILSWNGSFSHYISNSLAWLDADLAKARARGKHIVLNFHDGNDHFINETSDTDKAYFKQIITKYKVAAIFVGHLHNAGIINNQQGVYGSVPVYVADSLAKGGYYLVSVDQSGLTIEAWKENNSKPVYSHIMGKVEFPEKPVFCNVRRVKGNPGDIYSSYFTQGHGYFLKHQKTGKNLDGDKKGRVYLHHVNDGDNQKFVLRPVTDDAYDYNRYYKLTSLATGRVLDSDSNGKVYAGGWNGGHHQQWKIFKTANGHIMLTNRATNRILDADSKGNVYASAMEDINNVHQNWLLIKDHPRRTAQVYYYRLKTQDGYNADFPSLYNPESSNENWEYIGEHNLYVASPCIGW